MQFDSELNLFSRQEESLRLPNQSSSRIDTTFPKADKLLEVGLNNSSAETGKNPSVHQSIFNSTL